MRAPPPNAPSTLATHYINMECGAPAPPLRRQPNIQTQPPRNQPSELKFMPTRPLLLSALLLTLILSPNPVPAQKLSVPPAAQSTLDQIYSGDLTVAIDSARRLQQ